jgi:hypothetical protein
VNTNKLGTAFAIFFALSVVVYSALVTPRPGPVSNEALVVPLTDAFSLAGWETVSYQYYLWWLGKTLGEYELANLGTDNALHIVLNGRPELAPPNIRLAEGSLIDVKDGKKEILFTRLPPSGRAQL